VGLRIIVTDKGKGMERSERFLEERTRGLLDSGLTDTRRLVDHFLIESAPGMGTVVTMDLWKGAPTP
jgi:anti-sigma regulatory factor (Ser/Thr protein kinase)